MRCRTMIALAFCGIAGLLLVTEADGCRLTLSIIEQNSQPLAVYSAELSQ